MSTQLVASGQGAEAVVDVTVAGDRVSQGGRGHVLVRGGGDRGESVAMGVLVTDSLLLTSRAVASTPEEAEQAVVHVERVRRHHGSAPSSRPVPLAPDLVFVTSPALGWTLVAIRGHGLGVRPLADLDGIGVHGSRLRWVSREQLLADLRPRLRVLGAAGRRVAHELGTDSMEA